MFKSRLYKKFFPIEDEQEVATLLQDKKEYLRAQLMRYRRYSKAGVYPYFTYSDVRIKKVAFFNNLTLFERILCMIDLSAEQKRRMIWDVKKDVKVQLQECQDCLNENKVTVDQMNYILCIENIIYAARRKRILKGILFILFIIIFVRLCRL